MIAPTQLVRAVRATRPDVVHLHTGAWYKSALAARLAGVAARRLHRTRTRARRSAARALAGSARVAVGLMPSSLVSRRLHDYMIRSVGVRADRVVTIPSGVDNHALQSRHCECGVARVAGNSGWRACSRERRTSGARKAYERLVWCVRRAASPRAGGAARAGPLWRRR